MVSQSFPTPELQSQASATASHKRGARGKPSGAFLLLACLLSAPAPASAVVQQIQLMQAWSCHGRNQREMVNRLVEAAIVHTPAVRDVMYSVDRGDYVPINPYMDAPQGIGLGQTISAPHMHAHALEELYPYLARTPKDHSVKILDVGCGSGYLTAALGRWVKNKTVDPTKSIREQPTILGRCGKVFGIDVKPNLVALTQENMKKHDRDLLDTGTVTVQLGDGWKGLPNEAPFDAIHVGAAAANLPRDLAQQLRVGGVLIIPVGGQQEVQKLYRVERLDDTGPGFVEDDYRITSLLGVRYVPLINSKASP
mmetsp:Transcript_17431/g.48309  ORF Transcript_17431/g.48309 Transcript_17431/m.48309 type:complete len:310 (-) Transcript_17431:1763-2692(-)